MSVKLLMVGRRRAGQTLDEHRRHMRNRHGADVLAYIAEDPDNAPRRYVQNHVFDGCFSAGDPAHGPFALGLDFVTELWFPDLAAIVASRQTDFYLRRLQPDEDMMVDQDRVLGLPALELDAPPAALAPAVKVFALLGGEAGARAELINALGSLGDAELPHLHRVRSVALRDGPVDAVDTFWLPDATAAQMFCTTYREQMLSPLRSSGLLRPDGACLLIAHEYVLHAGDAALKGR